MIPLDEAKKRRCVYCKHLTLLSDDEADCALGVYNDRQDELWFAAALREQQSMNRSWAEITDDSVWHAYIDDCLEYAPKKRGKTDREGLFVYSYPQKCGRCQSAHWSLAFCVACGERLCRHCRTLVKVVSNEKGPHREYQCKPSCLG